MGSVIDIQKLRIRIPRQEAQKAEIAMARAREIAELFNLDSRWQQLSSEGENEELRTRDISGAFELGRKEELYSDRS